MDFRRGKLPKITTDEDTITFVMEIRLTEEHLHWLSVRCERNGEISLAIVGQPKEARLK